MASSTSEDGGRWHGWSHDNTALFIADTGQEGRVGLFTQDGRSTALVAVFLDEVVAFAVSEWLDGALTSTAAANSQLVDRLRARLPLTLPGTGVLHRDEAADVDDDE